MNAWFDLIIDFAVIAILIGGIRLFRTPRGARSGNAAAALALTCAMFLVLYRNGVTNAGFVIAALLIGSAAGWLIAMKVTMIQIPSMVAFQHGVGGVAAFLISFVELTRGTENLSAVGRISGLLGLFIGAATFSASMIASGKLAGKIRQTPVMLPRHGLMLAAFTAVAVVLSVFGFSSASDFTAYYLGGLLAVSIIVGVLFSVRIGGADMPVLISFLNATAGLAAAFCGVIVHNRLLIACGATVTASGSLLTIIMCRAMNRSLVNIFVGIKTQGSHAAVNATVIAPEENPRPAEDDPAAEAVKLLAEAKTIIVIPGYGMALAQAQFKVVELARKLEGMGKTVRFAIHPIAGRMPGHMNVLLAEADLPYDRLFEMDDINPEFAATDMALVVGASDVVNPAAATAEGTPIYGMPVMLVGEAKHVIVCNLDRKPGYSGVENTLYSQPNVTLLLGNAAETLEDLLKAQ